MYYYRIGLVSQLGLKNVHRIYLNGSGRHSGKFGGKTQTNGKKKIIIVSFRLLAIFFFGQGLQSKIHGKNK